MTALAANRNTTSRFMKEKSYPMEEATHIYKGGLVAVNAAGFAVPAADAANLTVVGVADEEYNNTGADGALWCRVTSGRNYLFAASSITQAMVNEIMHVVDDQTFDDGGGTNSIVAGMLVEYVSATSGWIYIPEGGTRILALAQVI